MAITKSKRTTRETPTTSKASSQQKIDYPNIEVAVSTEIRGKGKLPLVAPSAPPIKDKLPPIAPSALPLVVNTF